MSEAPTTETPNSGTPEPDATAAETSATAATVVAVVALLLAVTGADEVGRLSPTTVMFAVLVAAVIALVAFRSIFNRAHIGLAAAALVVSLIGNGGRAMWIMPLLVVVGALHLASSEERYPRTIPFGTTAGVAAAAFVIAWLLEGLTVGPFSSGDNGGGGEGSRTTRTPTEQGGADPLGTDSTTEPNAAQRFVGRVADFFRSGPDPAEEASDAASGVPATSPDQGIDWLRILLAVVIALAVLAAIVMLVRWWRRRRATSTTSLGTGDQSALRRLERIGERAARGRRPSEGPLTYGAAVDDLTGDKRLSAAGAAVSDHVYRPSDPSSTTSSTSVDHLLSDLEAKPPRPAEPPSPTEPTD